MFWSIDGAAIISVNRGLSVLAICPYRPLHFKVVGYVRTSLL